MPGARLVFNDDLPGLQEMMPGIKDFVRAIAMDAPRLRMEQDDRRMKAEDRTRQQGYEDEQRAVAPLQMMDPEDPGYEQAIKGAPEKWRPALASRKTAADRALDDKYTQEFQQRYVQPTIAQHNAMETAKARQASAAARQTARGNADKLYRTEHSKWASGKDELARRLSTEQVDDGAGGKRRLNPQEIAGSLQLYMMQSPEPQTSDVKFRVDGREDLFGGLGDAPAMDAGASSGQYAITPHPLSDPQTQIKLGQLYAVGRRTGDMRAFDEAIKGLMMAPMIDGDGGAGAGAQPSSHLDANGMVDLSNVNPDEFMAQHGGSLTMEDASPSGAQPSPSAPAAPVAAPPEHVAASAAKTRDILSNLREAIASGIDVARNGQLYARLVNELAKAPAELRAAVGADIPLAYPPAGPGLMMQDPLAQPANPTVDPNTPAARDARMRALVQQPVPLRLPADYNW